MSSLKYINKKSQRAHRVAIVGLTAIIPRFGLAYWGSLVACEWTEAEALLFGVGSYDDRGGVESGDEDAGIGKGKAA